MNTLPRPGDEVLIEAFECCSGQLYLSILKTVQFSLFIMSSSPNIFGATDLSTSFTFHRIIAPSAKNKNRNKNLWIADVFRGYRNGCRILESNEKNGSIGTKWVNKCQRASKLWSCSSLFILNLEK